MTAHELKDIQRLNFEAPYRKAKDIEREPLKEKTDEEIRAEMKESVRRNAKTLQILAKL